MPVFVYVLRIYPYQSINRCHLTKSIRKAVKLHVEFRIGVKKKVRLEVFAWRVKREDERVLVQQGVAVRNPCRALTNRTPSRKEMEKGRRSIPIRDA